MRKKVTPFPSVRKDRNRLRRVPVKIGARTLLFYRPILHLGPFRLMRGADGSLVWRWKRGRRHRLTPASAPVPASPYPHRPARESE